MHAPGDRLPIAESFMKHIRTAVTAHYQAGSLQNIQPNVRHDDECDYGNIVFGCSFILTVFHFTQCLTGFHLQFKLKIVVVVVVVVVVAL